MTSTLSVHAVVLAAVLAAAVSAGAQKVEHVVLLLMENRAFDHVFGFATSDLPGIDGLDGTESNPVDPSDPSKGSVSVSDANATYACTDGPSQAFPVTCGDYFGPGATDCAGPNFPEEQPRNGWVAQASTKAAPMAPFQPEQLPVKMALAKEFAVMDRYYASFPGPSTPNHLFIHSATAAGCMTTGQDYRCTKGYSFPQKTIYELLEEGNRTWRFYYNDSAWVSFIEWFDTPRGARGLETYDSFYDACETGTLPSFSFVFPRQGTNGTTGDGANDDHPCHDVALGERLLKDTFEAVRASPSWNKTLLMVTYDDSGGFYDHVPLVTGVPAPDDIPSCSNKFDYTLLGPRLPTLLISPLISKGRVIHEPSGPVGSAARPYPNSQYEHSSIAATLTELFDLPGPLTRRDEWAASFASELNLDEPRTDAIFHTPDAPAKSALPAVHGCGDPEELTRRQQRRVRHYAGILGKSEREIDDLASGFTPLEAEAWINEQGEAVIERARTSTKPNVEDEISAELSSKRIS